LIPSRLGRGGACLSTEPTLAWFGSL
jgi:hypothetical protein